MWLPHILSSAEVTSFSVRLHLVHTTGIVFFLSDFNLQTVEGGDGGISGEGQRRACMLCWELSCFENTQDTSLLWL